MADLFKLMGTIAVDNKSANASIDETTDKAESAGKRQEGAFSKVTNVAGKMATGIVAVGGTMVAAAGSMLALSTSTEDYAVQQGKLQTAFETTGKTAEQAQSTYMGLQGVLGDSDRAVEAAGNIAQLATSQQDLDKWTTICTGAFATFGDGLPVEGLAEAANETARTGIVTGSLADALNWTSASMDTWNAAMSGHSAAQDAFNKAVEGGMSKEDAFNEALKACTSEQERAQLVTDTLNGLYSEAGQKYSELNADLIASRQAQAEWNAVVGQAGEAVRPFATALMGVGTSLLTGLMPYLTQFADWAAQNLPVIVEQFSQFGAMVGEAIGAVAPYVQQFFQSFQEGGPMIEGFMEFMQPIIDAFSNFGATVLPMVVPLLTSLWTMLTQIGTTIASILGPAIQVILPLIINTVTQIAGFVIPILTQVFTFISTTLATLQPLVSAAMSFILGIIQTVWPHIQTIIQGVMTVIQSVISTVMGVIQGIITAIMGVISGDWDAVWSGIQQVASSIWQGIQGVVSGAIQAVSGVISGVLATIQSIWNGAWNAVSSVLSSAWEGIKSTVSSAIDGVVTFMSGLPGRILGALGNMGSLLVSAGRDLINGLKNGITGAIEGVVSAVKGGVDRVIGAAKGLLGIASPSKVFAEIGDYTMQGMEEGVEGGAPRVTRAMGAAVDDMVGAADDIAVPVPRAMAAAEYTQASPYEAVKTDIANLYALIAEYMPKILAASDKAIMLDTGALVGATASAYDSRLGEISRRRSRGY